MRTGEDDADARELATLRRVEEELEQARAAADRAEDLTDRVARLETELERARTRLARTEAQRERADAQLDSIRSSRAWTAIQWYRRLVTRIRSAVRPQPALSSSTTSPDPGATESAGPPPAPDTLVRRDDVASMAAFRRRLASWAEHAETAPGEDVVVMYSGTTYVQEHRGNRPIRLTNVYLDQQCPVFFNYYRWKESDPLPDHPSPELFQSPIDVTNAVLPDVFARTFGSKRRTFYVSFPHIDAVRMMSLAKSHGWTVVYDIRDDWEAFHQVGAAEWWDSALERWVVQAADVVTAVSEPLAEKLRIDAHRDDIRISANALDPSFPAAVGRPGPDCRTVGYFGHLTGQWFDWDLVTAAARALPQWRFELAGHGAPTGLDLPENVELLGLLDHEEIARRAATWAGALIPFRNGPVVDPLDPIKVYEHVHLRLPTVAGHYPPMADYPGVVITESVEDFVVAIEELPTRRVGDDEAIAFLDGNTWVDRVAHYRELVDDPAEHLGTRNHFDAFLAPEGSS